MSPKTDVTAERKQQIYQAAMACFNRKGYYQTTMDDIVSESGLSKGALYWYFDSKKQLFIAMLQDFLDSTGHEWEQIVDDKTMRATEKLQRSLAFFRAQFEEMTDFFGIVIEAWAQTHYDEDVQKMNRELYKPYLAYMNHILEEGITQGEFQIEDVQATSAVILTVFDGLTLAAGAGMFDYDSNRLLDAAEALILHGLGAEV
jgi:AcrR family transcriptional regulator